MSTKSSDYAIVEETSETALLIESHLLASLRSDLPQASNSPLVLAVRDEAQALIAGLTASTSYGWLLIKCLWVAPTARGTGLGRALVHEAHVRALQIGCHAAWLDTSNPQAQQFYTSLGYETFGMLANGAGQYPSMHHRWFMKKLLEGSASTSPRNT